MSFLYSISLKLLYPTSLCVLLLLAAAVFRKRQKLRRICFSLAILILLVCGNGWVVKYSTRYLESQYPPLPSGSSVAADCILVLGGGTSDKIPPRPTVEVGEAGDRVLYAAHLFKAGRAQRILCTSGIATGGIGPRPAADNMAELLQDLGVPESAIVRETASRNTHEHGENLLALLQQKGFKRIILVTSAAHMPRSMGVFKKSCPGIEIIPAPTDFRIVELDLPWYRELVNLIPTPGNLVQFSETMHEYLGMAYYRLRGWL
ncbi:MAG: YdcF family protein [Verrucomicrobia bacterium]|nr:YdcF family protein [Verrucomicrobiota bacterium]